MSQFFGHLDWTADHGENAEQNVGLPLKRSEAGRRRRHYRAAA